MAQIHPHQYLYFNFLVDRKTPEQLRGRYIINFRNLVVLQGYKHILRQEPASIINLKPRKASARRHINRNAQILPAAARNRLTYDPSRDPDFYFSGSAKQRFLLKDPFPPVLHRFKVYNNTLMTVSTPDLSRADPAVADAYRALHRAATAGEPAARAGGFKVYLHGGRLAWVKETCEPGELMSQFRLALYPADADRLPDPLRKRGYFTISAQRGVRFDGKCLGAARLPDFALARARLEQPGRWEVEIPL